MSRRRSGSGRVADHWDAEGTWQPGRGLYWLELAAVQHRLSQKVSGQPDVDWVRYTLDHWLAGRLPLGHCLSLGCGEGGLERQLARLGAFLHCDAYDVAAGSIDKARAAAAAAGYGHIQYAVCDLNELSLPVGRYDAVWASGAVHHFDRLDHVFGQIVRALKPDGMFILNEYVGPNRFQFPARQREVIQSCFELLPKEYRRVTRQVGEQGRAASKRQDWRWLARRMVDKLRDGDLIGAARRQLQRRFSLRRGMQPVKSGPNLPSARSVQSVDPSEAIRSADILPLLRNYFEIVDLKPLGGTILQFLLADIAGNFQDEVGEGLLEMLFTIEDTFLDCGDLNSDFAYIVAAQCAP